MAGADGVGAQGPVGTTQPTPNMDPPPPPRDKAAPKADTAASPESSPHSVTGESVGSVGVSFILFFTLSIF